MLRKLIAFAVLSLAVLAPVEVVLSAAAPPLPFGSYSEVVAAGLTHVSQTQCPASDKDVTLVFTEEKDGVRFKIMSTTERDVFMRIVNDAVTYVYFSVGNAAGDGVIHVKKVLTIDEAKAAYPEGPCSFLVGVDA